MDKAADDADLADSAASPKKSSVHLEEEIDAAAEALIAEENRRQDVARKELLSYCIFVISFMFVVMAWRDTGTNYAMS